MLLSMTEQWKTIQFLLSCGISWMYDSIFSCTELITVYSGFISPSVENDTITGIQRIWVIDLRVSDNIVIPPVNIIGEYKRKVKEGVIK